MASDTVDLEPEPAWEIARLFPPQGEWDEADYFALETKHGVFTPGQRAASVLLQGFEVDVTDVFAAADQANQ